MDQFFYNFDRWLVSLVKHISPVVARLSLAIIFVWFGALKVIGTSPANELVELLQVKTLPFLATEPFIVGLGLFEMIIGILILVPHWERASIGLLMLHMFTTFLPLIFLPSVVWQGFMTPTLEGQYIIKNLVIIALSIGIAAHLAPLKKKRSSGTVGRLKKFGRWGV